MSFLNEVRDDMLLQGLPAPIFIGEWTESPDVQAALFESIGAPGIAVQQQPGEKYVRQVVEVVVRHTTYNDGRALAQQFFDYLNGKVRNRHLGSTWYLSIQARSSPASFRRDDQDRFYFTTPAEAFKLPS